MPKDGAERKFAARFALRNGGKKQQDFAPPRKLSFFATPPVAAPPVAAEPPQAVAEITAQSEEYDYYFETPGHDHYVVVGTENALNYNWTAWFLGCGMQLIENAGKIGKPFWYACAPAIGMLAPANNTAQPVGGAFPPALTCLKSSCPPYIPQDNDADLSLPSIDVDPSIIGGSVLAAGVFLIFLIYLIRRSCTHTVQPAPQAMPLVPRPRPQGAIEIDNDDRPEGGCRVC